MELSCSCLLGQQCASLEQLALAAHCSCAPNPKFQPLSASIAGATLPCMQSDTGVQLSSCSYDCDCIGSVFEDSDLTLPMAHRGSWHELATITDCPAQGVLSVGRPDGLQSLDHLLHALVPPEAPLRTLCLQTDLPPAALLGCTRIAALHCLNGPEPGILSALPLELPHLTSLHLTGTAPATGLRPDQLPSLPALLELQLARCIDSSGGSAIDACMPALLSQAPQLTSLSVWGHLSHEDAEALEGPLPPPAWLASLQGVRELCLWHNRLGALLPGPYLEGELTQMLPDATVHVECCIFLLPRVMLDSRQLHACFRLPNCNPCRPGIPQPCLQCL